MKISVAPIVLTCLSGALFCHFAKVAPNCNIELIAWKSNSIDCMQNDQVTVGVSVEQPVIAEICAQHLLELEARIILRSGNTIQSASVTAKDMELYPIASIVTPGWNEHFTHAAVLME